MSTHDTEQSPLVGASFLQFSDLLTSYRLGIVLMLVEKIGLVKMLGEQGATSEQLCEQLGWNGAYGQRFFDCLCRLGLLEIKAERYFPGSFSQRFLTPGACAYQGGTLSFEQQLLQSWMQLEPTLQAGNRIYATEDKTPEELNQAFRRYLGAMDEAACQRAAEVIAALGHLPQKGTILDLGGGSGAYLAQFLTQNPSWSAIFCDLDQVVSAALQGRLAPFAPRITPCRCNLLAEDARELKAIKDQSCDLVLLSNLIHCQGSKETAGIIRLAAQKTAGSGVLLLHDFFSDCGWRDALYDLHMMLNTYNGRTYRIQECIAMATSAGFCTHRQYALPSGSTLLCFAHTQSDLPAALME
nr:class I SAM-dependent methyltransferase [uncultured Desulfobulbus sp.]